LLLFYALFFCIFKLFHANFYFKFFHVKFFHVKFFNSIFTPSFSVSNFISTFPCHSLSRFLKPNCYLQISHSQIFAFNFLQPKFLYIKFCLQISPNQIFIFKFHQSKVFLPKNLAFNKTLRLIHFMSYLLAYIFMRFIFFSSISLFDLHFLYKCNKFFLFAFFYIQSNL
jgi:hypothetical protein